MATGETYVVKLLVIVSTTLIALATQVVGVNESTGVPLPVVITTWDFPEAAQTAWDVLTNGTSSGSALDAVESGCNYCEINRCHGTVGFGGKPDENGETTLDAMIMDGNTHDVGAVGCLRRVKQAISVARKVMEHTKHTLLVGELAMEFAVSMGFKEENLTTEDSAEMHKNWTEANCQPNHWENVLPDPTTSCGPYSPIKESGFGDVKFSAASEVKGKDVGAAEDHDTIGMLAIDSRGEIAGGTSTNGLQNKVPGRVGDSPVPGSGAYVDRAVGGAAATGNGDIMMRFVPTHQTVEGMRSGLSPQESARVALGKIASYYPEFTGAIIAVRMDGEFGAACYGYDSFPFVVARSDFGSVQPMNVTCDKNVKG